MLRFARMALYASLFVLVIVGTGVLVLRSSVAHTQGEVRVPANTHGMLTSDVRIVRDARGVPHIAADSQADAVFALGFVHAQDRLWQMEFQRRLGSGRLAEAVGEPGLVADRFFRTLGVRQAAEASLGYLTPEERMTLDAYVGGVNAFLATRTGVLPPEFLLLGVAPEPWTPADVVVWQKMMAWDLTGSEMSAETLRARLVAQLGEARAAELFPGYPDDAPVLMPDLSDLYRELPWSELARSAPAVDPANGSNAWVVSAERTATARPLLANDPHLGLQAPSLWYFAHLQAPDFQVTGATLPGTPAVLLGHNGHIAWGLTNTGSDVLDLFIERVAPEDPSRYVTPEGTEPFETRRETIRVKGGEDVVLDVRESRHGPVISDVVDAAGRIVDEEHVVAMRWTALDPDDTTIGAALAMSQARSWDGFVAALERWVVPQQTMAYADVNGNIGMIAAARIPIRAGGRGVAPMPGWTGEFDWVDEVPFDALPRELNPEDGVLVAANHRLVGDDYPYHLTDDWTAPYRAERIQALIDATSRHTLDTFMEIQADVVSLHAGAVLDLLRETTPDSDIARRAQATLTGWSGAMDADAAAPLVFSGWYRAFVRELVEDELGDAFDAYYGFRPLFVESVLAGNDAWCDDVRTTVAETCLDISARALRIGTAELIERFGEEPSTWRWGDAHQAEFDHATLGGTPLGRLTDLLAPNDGGPFTVDVGSYSLRRPYTQDHGPGFRGLYDLSDLSQSRMMHAPGQSGNPLSLRYRDLLPGWIANEYLSFQPDIAALAAADGEVLVLRAP